ncbi:hypothetical protein SK128_005245, partial [Halocaridina rubra]
MPVSRVGDCDDFQNAGSEQSEVLDPQNIINVPPDWNMFLPEASHLPTGDWVTFENSEGVLADTPIELIPAPTVADPALTTQIADSDYTVLETIKFAPAPNTRPEM